MLARFPPYHGRAIFFRVEGSWPGCLPESDSKSATWSAGDRFWKSLGAGPNDARMPAIAICSPLVALAQGCEQFRSRLLADRVVHRVPPKVGNIRLRQRYAFGNKTGESMREGRIIVA